MSSFAAVVTRSGGRWRAEEVSIDECESFADLADVAVEADGDVRLLLIEEDDEYAALIRVDDEDEPRAFLSDGHAADRYPLAAALADELDGTSGEGGRGGDDLDDEAFDDDLPGHDSEPLGDAGLVADLGTSADELLAMCAAEGTLPIDLLGSVCERAGCGEFDDLRA